MRSSILPCAIVCALGLPALSAIGPWCTGFASRAIHAAPPKRPASPWIHFLSDFRNKHTDLPAKEVMTAASAEWKAMTDKQKTPFQEAFGALKKVYDQNKKTIVKSGKKEVVKSVKKRVNKSSKKKAVKSVKKDVVKPVKKKSATRVKKAVVKSVSKTAAKSANKKALTDDPEKPKRPVSPFLRFFNGYRTENSLLKLTEAAKKAGAVWKDMSVEEREPYQAPYQEEKSSYDGAMALYKARTRGPEKPKRPASGFLRFLSKYRTDNASLKLTEAAKKAGVAWKDMSVKEKEPYEAQYKEEKNKYDEAMKLYQASG